MDCDLRLKKRINLTRVREGLHLKPKRGGQQVNQSNLLSVAPLSHTLLCLYLCDASLAATLQISHELFIDGHGSQPADSNRSLCEQSSYPVSSVYKKVSQHILYIISYIWKELPPYSRPAYRQSTWCILHLLLKVPRNVTTTSGHGWKYGCVRIY